MRCFSAVCFLIGICLLFSCATVPATFPVAVVAVAALVIGALVRRIRWVFPLVAGFCWACLHAGQLLHMQLPQMLEGRDLTVRGVVEGLPEKLDSHRLRLRFRVQAYQQGLAWHKLELPVRLNWYHGRHAVATGERWQLRVRLKAAHGFANPGGFDYERWLFAARLRAVGHVRNGGHNLRLDAGRGAVIENIRQTLSRRLQELDLTPAQSGVLRALAIGERSGLQTEQWQLLAETGTSHLLAISGLHVGLVAGLAFTFFRRLWSLCGAAAHLPAVKAAAVAAMATALTYSLLAGFEVPAQRAFVMVWVWMLAVLLNATGRPWQVFAAALWVILLIDPLGVLTAGFWLSFAAVAWILYFNGGRSGKNSRVWRTISLQFALLAGLTPLLWLWFQQSAMLAPLANLVAIPWVGLLLVPMILLATLLLYPFPLAGEFLYTLAAGLLDILWAFLEWIAALPNSVYPAPVPDLTAYACAAAGLLVLLSPAKITARYIGVGLFLPLLLVQPDRPRVGDAWITVLDVGQGLAVTVQTRHKLLVYDTGPAFPSGFDTGRAVLVPFLRRQGYSRVDRLVVSHGDSDHRGGAASLAQQLPLASVHSGEPERLSFDTAAHCRRGESWVWDRVRFDYLAPPQPTRGNNGSCVLKITTPDGRSVLLPGDIEAPSERALLADRRVNLSADVLVAPHHGSKSSSTPAFVDAVRPSLVVFASGYRNRFGFPHKAVLERYRGLGSRVFQTDRSGAVSVKIESGSALQVSIWRRQRQRLWHWREK